MKKCVAFLMVTILFSIAGCKNYDTTVINKESQVQSESKSSETNDTEAILEDANAKDKIDVNIDTEEVENLNQIFHSKYSKLYDSYEPISVNNFYDTNFYETIWYVDKEIDGCPLMFSKDGKYILQLNRFGSEVIGTYEVIDQKTVKLKPVLLPEDPLYPEYCQDMTLSFKKDLSNFYGSDMLVLEGTDDIFYSIFCYTETGKEYIIDGYEVIKTDYTEHVIINRTHLKEKPEETSNNAKILIGFSIPYIESSDILINEYDIEKLEQLAQKDDSLLKGMSVTTLARTKDKYKIGETEDYWYYVSYYYFEGVDYEGWVYGGNLEVVDNSKLDEYVKMLRNEIDSLL